MQYCNRHFLNDQWLLKTLNTLSITKIVKCRLCGCFHLRKIKQHYPSPQKAKNTGCAHRIRQGFMGQEPNFSIKGYSADKPAFATLCRWYWTYRSQFSEWTHTFKILLFSAKQHKSVYKTTLRKNNNPIMQCSSYSFKCFTNQKAGIVT